MFKIPRIRAFLIHLAISLIVFLIPLYLIVFQWYPFPFFYADGGWNGIRIIVGAHLVIGPLLTFIVFKPGKSGLKFDLVTIGIVQAGALVWGTWLVYSERPIALVYTVNYFTTASFRQIQDTGFVLKGLNSFGNKSPFPVYVNLPQDPEQRLPLLEKSVATGTPLFLLADLYHKFDPESLQILKQNSDELLRYLKSDPKGAQLLDSFFRAHGEFINDSVYIPLHTRRQRLVIIVNAIDLSTRGSLNIDVTNYLLGINKKKGSSGPEVFSLISPLETDLHHLLNLTNS